MKTRNYQSMAKDLTLPTAVFILFILTWYVATELFKIPSYVVPTIGDFLDETLRQLSRGELLKHTAITAMQVVLGFGLGTLLGMAFGYVLGSFPKLEKALSPYILGLQIAPKVAFAPLFVMWFGFTVYPKVLVAILIVFFPIMVNLIGAMKTVDRDYVNLARSLSASKTETFWKIAFPSSMPALFSGLRIGATLAVIGVVVGEFVGGNSGLGYLLVLGEGQANTALVYVSIALLTAIGVALYGAVVVCERRVLSYLSVN